MQDLKPILTIAIPTYNRSSQLEELYSDFLSKIVFDYKDYVEIIVLDNSDAEIAKYNKMIFPNKSVRYLKNEINVGFSGNIINCVKEANGKFLWLISDDDYVDYDSFCKFIEYLNGLRNLSIKCVMLPFINKNFLGDKYICNTPIEWGVEKLTSLSDMIINGEKLPFILFSSAVIRLEEIECSLLDRIEVEYHDNDYMQIALYFELIGISSRVLFYDYNLQTYNNIYEIRFNLKSMRSSYQTIVNRVCKKNSKFKMNKIINRDNYRWLGWSFWSYIQLISMPDARDNRNELILAVLKSYSIKNIALSLMFYLPASLLRKVYIIIFSIKSARRNKKITFNEVKLKVNQMNNVGK
jgi:hypothetical protein